MNMDQVSGAIKDAAGRVQEACGKLIGSVEQRRKGIKKQIDGQVQRAIGDIDELIKGASCKK